jgi:hypothetical protein
VGHDDEAEPDGQAIKGPFADTHMIGTIRWIWDLELVK